MSDWKKTKIGDFLFEREGKYKPNDELIAGLQRIEKIDFSGNFHIAKKPSKTNMILIKKGDLVISGINVAKGSMGIYSEEDDVVATIHYSSYTFDETKINVGYFKRFLKSAEFIRLIEEQIKGGIKTEIKPKHILPLEILLPSLEEQELIVKHFESVETEDLLLNNEISNQQNLLKKLRQQILQDAIEGKLTKDWREQNPDVEPASELLKRIQAEKEQLIKDKKIKKQKALPEITEGEKPFELPRSWKWCRLDHLCTKITDGTHHSPNNMQEGDYKYITAKNIKNNGILMSNITYVTAHDHKAIYDRCNPEYGDLLLIKDGATTGVATLNNLHEPFSMLSSVALIKISESLLNKFILHGVRSQYFYDTMRKGMSGVAITRITLKKIKEFAIPLPPFEEQKEIVKKVENLFVICDQLEKQITSSQTNAEQLMQSVLKEAFSQESAA
jgi:type I restriction enzyme S subunit